MSQILFSAAGTTDPIRGEHDGPLLHIIRHYRPEKVFLFLTAGARTTLVGIGCTREKAIEYLCDTFSGYSPEITVYDSSITDPSDLDAVAEEMGKAFRECVEQCQGSEILVNVTSGTSQMQFVLSQLALDVRYHAKAIQVKNFEPQAGTRERTNDERYDLEIEIACNEDDRGDAPNRCVEPRMYPMVREKHTNQIRSLLQTRNFQALRQMKDTVPPELFPVIEFLDERSLLHTQTANSKRNQHKLDDMMGFALFPAKSAANDDYVSFHDVIEYAMLFRNLQHGKRFTEYLFRMEPLIMSLMETLVDRLLKSKYSCRLRDVVENRNDNFIPSQLQEKAPDLYNSLCVKMDVRQGKTSTYLMGNLIDCMGWENIPQDCRDLFKAYDSLKDKRNDVAHNLRSFDETVFTVCGKKADELTRLIEGAVASVYPQCDKSRFNVYDKCVDYIKNNL